VITQHNRGTSEYPPRVRSELAPRYRRRDDGQRNRGIGTIRPVTGRRIRGSWRPVSRPVVSQRFSGLSAPLSGSEIGAASGKPTSAPVVWRFFWEVSAPKSGSQFGEPGESIIRPAIAFAKAPQCAQSVDARYRRKKSRQIAESTIRPVTGVAGAPLPHHQPQFRSHSGRLHPHQATASTVTPGAGT